MAGKHRISSILEGANTVIDKGKERYDLNFRHGKQIILHGTLFIEILAATDLPDMDNLFGIKGLKLNKNDVTDAYVEVKLGNACLARTNVINNELNPKWNESYRIDVCHTDDYLSFCVLDKDDLSSEEIGSVEFKIEDLLDGEKKERKEGYSILKKRHVRSRGKLFLMVKFVPCLNAKKRLEVDSYFPVHENCQVTLYQDAHVDHHMPQFEKMDPPYKPNTCWTDVYRSIDEAEKVILIAGWSVWHDLKLFRQTAGEDWENPTLGELLVRKADQGVMVYLMLWQEYTGGAVGDTMGTSLGTHGWDTYNFFQNAGRGNIRCVLVPRTKGSFESTTDLLLGQFQYATYTHHQKTIVCDASCSNSSQRRIVAYVGGLDLTDGRWDTPNHELFSTLEHEHKGDFRNAMIHPKIQNIETQGPREPWHDIHCKLEGKIALDVFINFRERWDKQGSQEVPVLPLDKLSKFDLEVDGTFEPSKQWNCQLLRSINEDSANFDHKRTARYDKEHDTVINKLSRKSGSMVDSSILQAYVQQIRNAEHFIYIENQYFLGSSYCWELPDSEQQIPNKSCQHIIPAEIAQKIVQKIHKGSRFVAYILVPMFPEGDPTTAPIQEILHWQYRTIEMMYKKISIAIEEAGSNTVPTDWLVFMCLGKKEVVGNQTKSLDDATNNLFAKDLHFPIYVHSKMMIVDDVYIIVGSANINQRSMAGTRTTLKFHNYVFLYHVYFYSIIFSFFLILHMFISKY